MLVSVMDKAQNTQNFYFNEGVQVLGDSLNEAPTYRLFDKKTHQQIDNLFTTLIRVLITTD